MFVHKDGSVTGSVNVKELGELRKAKTEPVTEAKKKPGKAPAPKEESTVKSSTAEKKSAAEPKKEG